MPYAEFDTEIYFEIVADSLIRDHGQKAINLAEQALKKMERLGDDEGYLMWIGVHDQLASKMRQYYVPEGAVIH